MVQEKSAQRLDGRSSLKLHIHLATTLEIPGTCSRVARSQVLVFFSIQGAQKRYHFFEPQPFIKRKGWENGLVACAPFPFREPCRVPFYAIASLR